MDDILRGKELSIPQAYPDFKFEIDVFKFCLNFFNSFPTRIFIILIFNLEIFIVILKNFNLD